MYSMEFDQIQVLAVTWVWQREIYPKFLYLKSQNSLQFGKIRKKEQYVADYNQLVKNLFSNRDIYSIKVHRPAMSMLSEYAGKVLEPFRVSLCKPGTMEWHGYGRHKIEHLSLEEVMIREYITPLQPRDLNQAKRNLRKLLAVHDSGELVFNPDAAKIRYSSKDKFQQLTIHYRFIPEE